MPTLAAHSLASHTATPLPFPGRPRHPLRTPWLAHSLPALLTGVGGKHIFGPGAAVERRDGPPRAVRPPRAHPHVGAHSTLACADRLPADRRWRPGPSTQSDPALKPAPPGQDPESPKEWGSAGALGADAPPRCLWDRSSDAELREGLAGGGLEHLREGRTRSLRH